MEGLLFGRFGDNICEQFKHDAALFASANADLEEATATVSGVLQMESDGYHFGFGSEEVICSTRT